MVRPPERRAGYTQDADIEGTPLNLSFSEYHDGRLWEVVAHGRGAESQVPLSLFIEAFNIAAQNGVSIELFVDRFVGSVAVPFGEVNGNSRVMYCSSLIDYMMREIGISYFGRTDLANFPPYEIPDSADREEKPEIDTASSETGLSVLLTDGRLASASVAVRLQQLEDSLSALKQAISGDNGSLSPELKNVLDKNIDLARVEVANRVGLDGISSLGRKLFQIVKGPAASSLSEFVKKNIDDVLSRIAALVKSLF